MPLHQSGGLPVIDGPHFKTYLVRLVPFHMRNLRVSRSANLREPTHPLPAPANINLGIKTVRVIVGTPAAVSLSPSLIKIEGIHLRERPEGFLSRPAVSCPWLAVEYPNLIITSVGHAEVKKN